jgi:hypothetical protein
MRERNKISALIPVKKELKTKKINTHPNFNTEEKSHQVHNDTEKIKRQRDDDKSQFLIYLPAFLLLAAIAVTAYFLSSYTLGNVFHGIGIPESELDSDGIPRIINGTWKIGEELGSGSFGVVYVGTNKFTGEGIVSCAYSSRGCHQIGIK